MKIGQSDSHPCTEDDLAVLHRLRNLSGVAAPNHLAAYRVACEKAARINVLHLIAEAIRPGYSPHPATDSEILAHVREVVEELQTCRCCP